MDQPELPSLSDLLTGATKTVLDRPGTFVTLWAFTSLPVQLIFAVFRLWVGLPAQAEFRAGIGTNFPFLAVAIPGLLLAGLIQLLGHAAATVAAADAQRGAEPVAADCLSRAGARLPSVLWTAFVVGLRIAGAFLLLIIPGVYLSVMYSLSHYTTLLEEHSGGAAAARSWDLVGRDPAKIIGNSFVFGLVTLAAMGGMMGVALVMGIGLGLAGFSAAAPFAGLVLGPVQTLISAWTTAAMTGLFLALATRTPIAAPAPAP